MPVIEEDEREIQAMVARLRRVEGQIRGLVRMLEEKRECTEVVHQLLAAHAALEKAGVRLLLDWVQSCILNASISEEERQERMREFFDALFRLA